MKNIICFLFGCVTSSFLFSQSTYIVSGQIIDATTKLPMQAASVFAQNTTIGTVTNVDGFFKLELPNGGYGLAVTFTGYQTEVKRITTADASDKNIVIELKQKEKELQDVIIRNSYEVLDGWEKYGNFFLENFLGKSENSKQCNIKNTSALKFYFYKRKNRLKVLATEPLEIVNNALGYNIKYTLDSFTHEFNTQVSLYSGYPLFEEIKPITEEQKGTWSSNRTIAYNGSILHFMRSIYTKKLKEEGFEIQFLIDQNEKESALPINEFYGAIKYVKDDSTGIVEIEPIQNNLIVIYKNEKPSLLYLQNNPDAPLKFELSVLNFAPKQPISIEQNGYYFDQSDITINSYWVWEKVADMLPYDFKPL